jgi:hypothetical protein
MENTLYEQTMGSSTSLSPKTVRLLWKTQMPSKLYCDPPLGWQYGFPKPVPAPEPDDFKAWLVSEGYPKKLIDDLGENFWCRFFHGTEKD